MFRATNFDKLLDKATSNLRLDPDWPAIIQICDLIRQNDCTPKYAVAGVKKKLYSQNPHQAMFALLVMESIVKNCGSGIHDEIASKVNCEMFRELVKTSQHDNLRSKILELIQAWAFAFRNTPKYRAVQDTVNIMKAEGYKFPPLKESDAMFSADCAPEWADGDVCNRCRVPFTLMQRKHHCRACGQVFCQQCSSKTTTLPKFGIEKEVRVCEACFDNVSRPPPATQKTETSDKPPRKTSEELQEEEELQLALALSQSEAEEKEKQKKRPVYSTPIISSAPPVSASPPPSPEPAPQQGGELSRYLDRGYWEQRAGSTVTTTTGGSIRSEHPGGPTAPAASTAPSNVGSQSTTLLTTKVASLQLENGSASDAELEEFVSALKSQVEIFVNRMKSNSSRGRSIANDTSVQTLFMNITAMHSRLLRYIQQQDDTRVHIEGLQDKLSQTRDSRAALDVLREEHSERLARAAEAAERQRALQMAHKLHTMRKKKHEYLQYQRQLALQRVQEQEREMQMRQEQQKHQYMMGVSSPPFYVQGSPVHQFQQAYPTQGVFSNPQFTQLMAAQQMPDGPPSGMMPPVHPGAAIQQQVSNNPNMTQQISQPGAPSISQPNVAPNPMGIGQTQQMGQAGMRVPGPQPVHVQSQMLMQQMHQMRMTQPSGPPGAPQGPPPPNQNPQGLPGAPQLGPPQNQPQGQIMSKQGHQPPSNQMPPPGNPQQLNHQLNPQNQMMNPQNPQMAMPPGQGMRMQQGLPPGSSQGQMGSPSQLVQAVGNQGPMNVPGQQMQVARPMVSNQGQPLPPQMSMAVNPPATFANPVEKPQQQQQITPPSSAPASVPESQPVSAPQPEQSSTAELISFD